MHVHMTNRAGDRPRPPSFRARDAARLRLTATAGADRWPIGGAAATGSIRLAAAAHSAACAHSHDTTMDANRDVTDALWLI